MKNLNIPEGYQQVMPYLIVESAAAFFTFAKSVFGAEEKYKAMRTEALIMHAEISIGSSVIMFADSTQEYAKQTAGLFIYVNDCDQVYQKALASGAVNVMEPAEQSYGRSAGIKDPFGNIWWLTTAV
jgi:PhnB protein